MKDLIYNGSAQGGVASTLLQNDMSVHSLRPWVGKDGRTYIAQINNGKLEAVPVHNANALLRREEWIELDRVVMAAAQPRMRVVNDLKSAGLTYNIPNGMGKTVLQSQRMGLLTPATVSMDPIRKSEADRPQFDLTNLPLPIIHKDFQYTARELAVSRNSGNPLDTTTAEMAARVVGEEAEKMVLGIGETFRYAEGFVYGLTNFPGRTTKVLLNPASGSWSGAVLVSEIISMKQLSTDQYRYGPWVLYVSPNYSTVMDSDYSPLKGDNTIRDRIKAIEGITDIRTADYLTGYQMILVQMTSDVIRLVTGFDITTIQWETQGGMQLNFKVMAMLIPQLREDFNGSSGIVHGTAP